MSYGSISSHFSLEARPPCRYSAGSFHPWGGLPLTLILARTTERREAARLGTGKLMLRGLEVDPRLSQPVFTGFGDRLLSEVKKLAPKDVKIKVRLWGVLWDADVRQP